MAENPGIKGMYNDDYSILLYQVRADGIDRYDFFQIKDLVESINFPSEVTIKYQGYVPQDLEMEQMFGADILKTTLLS